MRVESSRGPEFWMALTNTCQTKHARQKQPANKHYSASTRRSVGMKWLQHTTQRIKCTRWRHASRNKVAATGAPDSTGVRWWMGDWGCRPPTNYPRPMNPQLPPNTAPLHSPLKNTRDHHRANPAQRCAAIREGDKTKGVSRLLCARVSPPPLQDNQTPPGTAHARWWRKVHAADSR
jgi:hypothetical protein